MDWDHALATLTRDAEAGTYPELAYEDLVSILADAVAYVTWEPATAYPYGTVIAPTVPNGHVYRARAGGTSGDTEPVWPERSLSDPRPGTTRPLYQVYGLAAWPAFITDATVTWQEDGPLPPSPWNLRRATGKAWRMKAGRCSSDTAFKAGQLSVGPEPTYQHCVQTALRWEADIV